jgi:hypothetical protein
VTVEPVPPARRLPAPRWLDPRVIFGALVVIVPMLVGAHVLASSSRYALVYVARHALVPGEHLGTDDVVVGRVRFDGEEQRYVAADRVPVGYVVTRYVAPGELLPLAALSAAPEVLTATRLVTVPVVMGHAPLALSRGDVVDVYVTAKSANSAKSAPPRLVVGAVPVDSVAGSGALASSGTLSVAIEVPASEVAAVVRAIEGGVIDVVRVPDATVAEVTTPAAASPSASPTPDGSP